MIQPALSAEEWNAKHCVRRSKGADDEGVFPDGSKTDRHWTIMRSCGQVFVGAEDEGEQSMMGIVPTADHALAALCLHGQPFGFTREDAAAARVTARFLSMAPGMQGEANDDIERLRSMAQRIEALLPPDPT